MTPRRSLALAVVIALIAVATAFFATSKTHSSADVDKLLGTAGAEGAALVKPAPGYGPLPSLAPATAWDNSPPLTDASLKGKVVLVDFWDASCINCRRTFDFLRRLQATYSSQGLVILGIHSPEFAFEKSHSYVAEQVRELHVTWPVAEDPQMAIWNEFGNEYWPANYLTDRNGNIRYYHFGEGDEEQIEGAVRALLAEGGSAGSKIVGTVPESQQPPSQNENVTPETYIGTGHGDLTSVVKLSAGVVRTTEYATLQTSQSLTLTFNAKDVYVVLDPGGTTPRTLSVTLDGRPLTDARRGPDVSPDGVLTVGHEDLFHVVTGGEVSAGTLVLTSTGGPVQVYSFTFGG